MRFKEVSLSRILLNRGIISEEQYYEIKTRAAEEHKPEGITILEAGYASEQHVAEAIATKMDLPLVHVSEMVIPDEVLNIMDPVDMKKYTVFPYAFENKRKNILCVAMVDPMDFTILDDVEQITRCTVEPAVCTAQEILSCIDRYYGVEQVQSAVEKYMEERKQLFQEVDEEGDDEINSSPIVVLVNNMIEQAARQRASDIHIEALSGCVRVRFRIDGVLHERMVYDLDALPAIIARIKIIGGMDISEKRKPQDGRITIMVDRREYDIRVSILPTVYGEKCVMRLALKKGVLRTKERLGMTEDEQTKFDNILSRPNGIVLVTGPTGSGKSTTLYTALSELNREDVNIVTIEDPVEANIDGINQIQVNPKADLTFASALRAILRQDPDIIMIGEIRDGETASTAIQASITGHLVVSTLHTNSTANTITRLLDMGAESYLIADAVTGVIAQRLVRRLCPFCKEAYEASAEEKEGLGVDVDDTLTLYRPCGCSKCGETGYHDRIGVYEIMEMSPKMRRLIAGMASTSEIQNLALEEGMQTLRMSASRLVKEGVTAYTEMLRIAMEE